MIYRSPHLLILIAVLGSATIWLTRLGVQRFESQVRQAATEQGIPSSRPVRLGPQANGSGKSPALAPRVSPEETRAALRRLAGQWLVDTAQLELTPEGRLVSLRQSAGPRSPGAYDPIQPAVVLGRARQFLAESEGALGAAAGTTFGDETVRADAHQGDVFFRQVAQGIPLAPRGSLSLTFGAGGELKSLAADLVPSPLEITGAFQLTPEIASRAAANFLGGELQGRPLDSRDVKGGVRKIWVLSRENGTFEGRPSFEFVVRGRKIVVDAQTGEILFKRDQRIF